MRENRRTMQEEPRYKKNVSLIMFLTCSFQDFESGRSTPASQWQNIHDSHQCLCGYDGPLADHLRASPLCVQTLRREQALEMGGSEEQFIVKATLLLKGCPAASCPGLKGGHFIIKSTVINPHWHSEGLRGSCSCFLERSTQSREH